MTQNLQTKVIYALRHSLSNGFVLVIAEDFLAKVGSIIEQFGVTDNDVVFQVTGQTQIDQKLVLQRIDVKCRQANNKYLIPHDQFNNIIEEINRGYTSAHNPNEQKREQSYSDSEDDDDVCDDEYRDDDSQISSIKRKRQISQYHDYSDAENQDGNPKKSRGRPKGSKNKKTLIKERVIQGRQNVQDLRLALTGKIKRGKGRPKGSKNRRKERMEISQIKQENQQVPFGKRGKGRPKGSKNKIKTIQQQVPNLSSENIPLQKRGRGRPKGAKNKPHSTASLQESKQKQQVIERFKYQRQDKTILENLSCCRRCYQFNLKRDIYTDKKDLQDYFYQLTNIVDDLSLENRDNILLNAIKEGQKSYLKKILEIADKSQSYFSPPWQIDRLVQRSKYEVKTKKQYLSKTGKQGINVLLHDTCLRKQTWWKQLGVQRIIESLPHESPGIEIFKQLCQNNAELKAQLYKSLPTIIRTGNHYIAQHVLQTIVLPSSNNQYNYTQQHYELINGNSSLLNQYKKFNLIKHNDGNNFCSPIHCAAISPSPQFMNQLLQLFGDIINVEDSIHRKPIHYASASTNIANLIALVDNGAQLKQYDRRKITPLMIACIEGIQSNVEYIVERVRDPTYINYRSEQGYTALHYAILKNQVECVETLLNDLYIDIKVLTKEDQDVYHLVAGTGNLEIFQKLLSKGVYPINSDRFKRTPAMIAIRNHNNQIMYKLLEEGSRHTKCDSSLNTLMHYAAAYGNTQAILLLRTLDQQHKNKRGYYPWEMAVLKGHLGCAYLLEQSLDKFQFEQDPLYLLLSNIRGTQEYFKVIIYVVEKLGSDKLLYQDRITGNGYLHLVCNISEEEYEKNRRKQTNLSTQQIIEQFQFIENRLIDYFLEKGLDGLLENRKKQSPLKLCIQNNNLIGFKKLLTCKINFELQSSYGSTIMHCLSNLACSGYQQMQFVHSKLNESDVNELRINLKKIDHNGFDFLLYFVKNFTQNAKAIFKKNMNRIVKINSKIDIANAQKQAFDEFIRFQNKFIELIKYLIELGCDVNGQVSDKRSDNPDSYKKWGIQHFLMKFPSLKLIKFFKNKIRDFNAQNNFNRTPLHLFCMNIKQGNLLETTIQLPKQYLGEQILQYLLANGLNASSLDSNRSLAILYAALNHQYSFITTLRKYKSPINVFNSKNQVPFIEIIKNSKFYNLQQIEIILKNGVDPNFEDMDKRNSLHHLVYRSTNFDTSPQVCKLLFDYGVKINALDKYKRSPIFYCFTKIDVEDVDPQQANDKVQILQVLLNHKDINLNLLDVYNRTLVHYACQKNYFFSILYLLDKNINIQIGDYQENTPLGVCLRHRNLNQAALIIKKGVKYGFVHDGQQKQSYFSYAMHNLSVGICFMLLDYGYPIQKALEQVQNQAFKEVLIQKYIK